MQTHGLLARARSTLCYAAPPTTRPRRPAFPLTDHTMARPIPNAPTNRVEDEAGMGALLEALKGESLVAVDTEFHSERSYTPRLMLLQVATRDQIWLVDPLAGFDLAPVFDVLAQPGCTVLGHALRNDIEIMALRYGRVPARVFDTQVAAAFLGHGLQIGLAGLLRTLLDLRLAKDSQMSDWSRRPLSPAMSGYAADDVRYLHTVHDMLQEDLVRRDRVRWVDEECAELCVLERYGRDPAEAWQRVSGARRLRPAELGVLVEVAAERERIAAAQDIVPHFLLPDDRLVMLARRRPEHMSELDGDRRMHHRALGRHADQWLAAVARGVDAPMELPRGRPPPRDTHEAVASLMMLVVARFADELALAPQLLVKRKDLLRALEGGGGDHETLVAEAGLVGWRAELLADPLRRLLRGELLVSCAADEPDGYRIDLR